MNSALYVHIWPINMLIIQEKLQSLHGSRIKPIPFFFPNLKMELRKKNGIYMFREERGNQLKLRIG